MSLHPSFGLVCWADDDDLKHQFQNSSAIEFLQFGELSLDDKQTLCVRVASLMDILGIPALSKVVCREAIFYGTGNNREKASLLVGFYHICNVTSTRCIEILTTTFSKMRP